MKRRNCLTLLALEQELQHVAYPKQIILRSVFVELSQHSRLIGRR